jgi:glycosyltransferase involved in cell wall biosynthesis
LSGASDQSTRAVICFATQGTGSGDERRIVELLAALDPTVLAFDRGAKRRTAIRLLREFRRRRPAVVVMEGTGLAGGIPLLLARRWLGTRYVVSCGDAVAPYLAAFRPWLRPIAYVYERLLYTCSAGVIGWSPYIVGRAVSMGAPRAATAANWCAGMAAVDARAVVRRRLDIPEDAVVFGIVGSLDLTRRLDWCYGGDLVRALRLTDREDLRVLIVGEGTGRARLEELAGDELGRRVLLPGRCAPEDVLDQLAAMDVASLPQTVDSAGALRYTSKLSEYVAAGLPVVTGQLPLAYDLDDGWMWRLPGDAPWHPEYLAALAVLMQGVSRKDLTARRAKVPTGLALFDRETQQRRVAGLIQDIIARP